MRKILGVIMLVASVVAMMIPVCLSVGIGEGLCMLGIAVAGTAWGWVESVPDDCNVRLGMFFMWMTGVGLSLLVVLAIALVVGLTYEAIKANWRLVKRILP